MSRHLMSLSWPAFGSGLESSWTLKRCEVKPRHTGDRQTEGILKGKDKVGMGVHSRNTRGHAKGKILWSGVDVKRGRNTKEM